MTQSSLQAYPRSNRNTRSHHTAATEARKRFGIVHDLSSLDQASDTDSDDPGPGPPAPRNTPAHSDDSGDSDDVSVADTESDKKGRKKKKRNGSLTRVVARRMVKGGKRLSEMDGMEPGGNEEATGYAVKSGKGSEDSLLEAASRPEAYSWLAEMVNRGADRGRDVRRAGLSAIGPANGRSRVSERLAFESVKGGARGPVDGNGHRVSRFVEDL